MRNLAINWHEGQFLRPQHFQAADRFWSETTQTSQQWDHPYHYGIQSLEFSSEALANHQFEVHTLRARLRDGTLVDLGAGQEPDRIDLKEALSGLNKASTDLKAAFETNSVIRVYLGVPKLKLGRANLGRAEGETGVRYLETTLAAQDENEGGNDQDLEFRCLNVRLLLSPQDLSGFDLLPIAQLKRASEGGASPQLDADYIPPVLSIQAWAGLGKGIVRGIYDMMGQKIEVLSQQVISRGVGFDSRYPGDLDRLLLLSELNAAYSTLAVLASTKGVHPLTAYTELCRLIGQLSIFAATRRVEELPVYDHEDLAGVFGKIRIRFEKLLNTVRDYDFEQRYFEGVGLGMQVSLEQKWFNSDWQWYVGVKKGELTAEECRGLLSPGQLDWKFGSSRQVEALFQNRAEGLELVMVDRPLRALPAGDDWLYYEIARKDTPALRDVRLTQTLAVRLKDSLILNLDRLQGERQLVVSVRGKRVALQFALFAVPTNV